MQLTMEQLNQLKTYWPLTGEIVFHRRVANFVYLATLGIEEVVLRLTLPTHRQKEEIESELHWMSFLAQREMKLAAPIRTKKGEFVAEIEGDTKFFASIFLRAPGTFLKVEADFSPQMIETWGKYLGKMHRLTKHYQVPPEILRRQDWEQDDSLVTALRSLDHTDQIAFNRMEELRSWMRSLEKNKNCYGLVHCDLHQGNFFVDQGELTAFDFDDCCYHWFTYDLIPPLNSINKYVEGKISSEHVQEIFLKGYHQENQLEQIWIDRIELFDKYRAGLIYHWIKTSLKENVFDAKGIEWARINLPLMYESFKQPLRYF